jgi:hypothetical protein
VEGWRESEGWRTKGKELTFHIDTLLFAEGRTELLHFGSETTLGIAGGERVMLYDVVEPSWWKRMIGGRCECADALD